MWRRANRPIAHLAFVRAIFELGYQPWDAGGLRLSFDRVEAGLQAREESVRRLQVVVLHAHAVERDVDARLVDAAQPAGQVLEQVQSLLGGQ